MFTHPRDVVRALERYRDCYDPRTTSLMAFGGIMDPHSEPFRGGFISYMEERAELIRRLEELDLRSQKLLVMWHVQGHAVTQIARELGMSRVHCYRVQRKAVWDMLDPDARVRLMNGPAANESTVTSRPPQIPAAVSA